MDEKTHEFSFLKAISRFSIIPNDRNQALRIRRFFMASAAYVLCGSLGYISYLAGFVEWTAIAGILITMPTIMIILYIFFRTGLNLKMADPSMTTIQMCTAILLVTYVMYFAHESRGVLLMAYIVVLLFGIFRLNTRNFLYVSIFTLLAYGGIIVLLHLFRPQGVNFHIEYLQWAVLSLVLVAFSIIGGYISSLRRNLSISQTELKKSIAMIQEMAIRDELTGIFNRRHLMELLEYEKNRSSRGGGIFSLAMLDIDHFKNINDSYGHLTGDDVLRKVGATIQAAMRSTDFCGRYGGEEFLLVLTQTPIDGALICSERLRASLENLQFPEMDPDFKVTVSLGVTEYKIRETVENLIARSDHALYQAKESGRNRVVSV